MSKRIDYNNENKPVATNRATVVPNAAPAVAKTSGMSITYKIIAIVLIVLAVLAVALLVINLIVNSYVNKINTPSYEDVEIKLNSSISNMDIYSNEFTDNDRFKDVANSILLNYAEASHAIVENENVYNFAIYGVNKFEASEEGTATFIMVVSFNKETKKTTYAVFEENVLVYIPMVREIGNINDAYEWGGAPLLTKTIKHNFGIEINGYIELDMGVAAKLFDSKGGITVEAENADVVNNAIKSYNEKFKQSVPTISSVSGKQAKLNGLQAIAYLRSQNDNSAIVTAIGKTILKGGLFGLMDSFKIITEGAMVSIEREDLIDLAKMANSVLKKADSTVVNVGKTTKTQIWKGNIGSNYIDYEAERNTLLNAVYAAE